MNQNEQYLLMSYDSNGIPMSTDMREYVKNALVFDRSRLSIYAQNQEFGYVGVTGNYIDPSNLPNAYVITNIVKDPSTGLISYSYSSVVGSGTILSNTNIHVDSVKLNENSIDVLTGLFVNQNNGALGYLYHTIKVESSSTGIKANSNDKVITNTYLSKNGVLSYAYFQYSTPSLNGTISEEVVSDTNKVNVITGIDQSSGGQVTYSMTQISIPENTHSVNPNHTDTIPTIHENGLVKNVYLSADGILSYSYKKTTYSSTEGSDLTINTTGIKVITGLSQSNDGDISYTYSNIKIPAPHDFTYSVSGDFITSIVRDSNGDLSVGTGEFSSEGVSTTSLYYVSNISINHSGKISYTYNQIRYDNRDTTPTPLNPTYIGLEGIEVLTNVNRNSTGSFSYQKSKIIVKETEFASYLSYIEHVTNTSAGNYVVTNIYKDTNSNKFTFTTNDLSTNSGSNTTTLSLSSTNKVNFYNSNGTNGVNVITGITQRADGKISYTYTSFYLNPSDFYYGYYYLNPTHTTYTSSGNSVNVLSGFNITGANVSSGCGFSYGITEVPTKKYVDGLIAANDAMRYCGTVTPSTTENGAVTFAHNPNPGPGHTVPDYSTGAVYKVTGGPGYFGTEIVKSGDVIISCSDSATSTPDNKWNVINENLNLRTNYSGNTGTNTNSIITGVNLSDDGTLSYITGGLRALLGTITNSNSPSKTAGTGINPYNINNSSTTSGVKVITDVSLSQNGLDTSINYTYSYIYSNLAHHSLGTVTKGSNDTIDYDTYTYLLSGVNISSTGALSYTYTPVKIGRVSHSDTSTYIDYIEKNLVIGQDRYLKPYIVNDVSIVDNVLTVTYSDVSATGNITANADASKNISNVTIVQRIEQTPFGAVTYIGKSYDLSVVKVGIDQSTATYLTGVTSTNNSSTLYTHLNRDAVSYIYGSGKLYVNHTYVGHNLNVKENAKIGGSLNVSGATTLSSTLDVSGTTSLNGNMNFGNATTDVITIKSASITLSTGNTKFTNLKSLWGTVS